MKIISLSVSARMFTKKMITNILGELLLSFLTIPLPNDRPLNNCSLLKWCLKSDHIHPKQKQNKDKDPCFFFLFVFLVSLRKNRQDERSFTHSNSQLCEYQSPLSICLEKHSFLSWRKYFMLALLIGGTDNLFHFLTKKSLFLQHVHPPDVPPVQG